MMLNRFIRHQESHPPPNSQGAQGCHEMRMTDQVTLYREFSPHPRAEFVPSNCVGAGVKRPVSRVAESSVGTPGRFGSDLLKNSFPSAATGPSHCSSP